jgi:hypothetical protein
VIPCTEGYISEMTTKAFKRNMKQEPSKKVVAKKNGIFSST